MFHLLNEIIIGFVTKNVEREIPKQNTSAHDYYLFKTVVTTMIATTNGNRYEPVIYLPISLYILIWPQEAVPPGFNPLRRGWVYRPAPEAPLLRGIPTGSEAFLEMPGACGLRPCAWPHPKKGLVPYSSGWWDGGQIPSIYILREHIP